MTPASPIDAIRPADPQVPDWDNLTLPPAWPDQMVWWRGRDLVRILRSIFGQHARVKLPDDLPGRDLVPTYMLQEFHGLPNGYYSQHVMQGYSKGFEVVMLGELARARQRMAQALQHCSSVLDLGCGSGRTAAAIAQAGVQDVWGLDPSPYLLQIAARHYPAVKFVQGVAENVNFTDQRFSGVAVCFLFHEMPPKYADQALREIHRILQPGGTLVIVEPSPVQLFSPWRALLRRYGWRGGYFKWLALRVFEPFVKHWHRRDLNAWFDQHGFQLESDETGMPTRFLLARKR